MNTPSPSQPPPRKPVLEILHDIQNNAAPRPRPVPLADPAKVAQVAMVVSLIALAVCVITTLLAIWEAIPWLLGIKIIATIAVLVVAMHVFRVTNDPE